MAFANTFAPTVDFCGERSPQTLAVMLANRVVTPAARVWTTIEETAVQSQQYGSTGDQFQVAGHGVFLMGQDNSDVQ
jgi:hypothetical protein